MSTFRCSKFCSTLTEDLAFTSVKEEMERLLGKYPNGIDDFVETSITSSLKGSDEV